MDKMLFEFFYPNIPYQSSRSETKGRNQMVGQPELEFLIQTSDNSSTHVRCYKNAFWYIPLHILNSTKNCSHQKIKKKKIKHKSGEKTN